MAASFYPPGLVIIPCSDLGRFTAFAECMVQLRPPVGSRAVWAKSSTIVGNLNLAIHPKVDPDEDWSWVWIIGDDHTFPPNVIHLLLDSRLADGSEPDVVVPIVSRRGPFHPVLYEHTGEEPDPAHNNEVYPRFRAYSGDEIGSWGPGCHEIGAAGTAGMLIRRHVLETLGFPYFTASSGHYLNEDLLFCLRVRELGFNVCVDTRLSLGHIGIFKITPRWLDGKLRNVIDFSGGTEVVLEEDRAYDIEVEDDPDEPTV